MTDYVIWLMVISNNSTLSFTEKHDKRTNLTFLSYDKKQTNPTCKWKKKYLDIIKEISMLITRTLDNIYFCFLFEKSR